MGRLGRGGDGVSDARRIEEVGATVPKAHSSNNLPYPSLRDAVLPSKRSVGSTVSPRGEDVSVPLADGTWRGISAHTPKVTS